MSGATRGGDRAIGRPGGARVGADGSLPVPNPEPTAEDPLSALVWLVTAMALTGDTRPAEEFSRRVAELASSALADATLLVGAAVSDLLGRDDPAPAPSAEMAIDASSTVRGPRPRRKVG